MQRLRGAASSLLRAQRALGGPAVLFRDAARPLALGAASFTTQPGGTADSIYCINVSGLHGNSPFLIGLMEYFSRQVPSVGFFQPIGAQPLRHGNVTLPKHVAIMKSHFGLRGDPNAMYGVTAEEAMNLLAAGRQEELMDRVYSRYQEYKEGKEMVILEGATVDGIGNQLELNARMAAELQSPVLMIMSIKRDELPTVAELYNRAMIYKEDVQAERADVLGVVLNKVNKKYHGLITSQLSKKLVAAGLPFAGGIPSSSVIGTARLNEVVAALDARLLYGDPGQLDSDISQVYICASDIAAFLEKCDELEELRNAERGQGRPLVLTTKDRADALLSLAAANIAGTGPHIAGLIMAAGATTSAHQKIYPATDRILSRASEHMMPVLEVQQGLFETARLTATVNPGILPDSTRKIEHAKQLFNQFIDADVIISSLNIPKAPKLTPKAFIHSIHEICRSQPQNIVLPESHDRRVLAAACECVAKNLCKVTLLGKEAEVKAAAKKFGIDISGCSILDYMAPSPQKDKYADMLVEIRKAKGLTREGALDLLGDMNMFATMMVRAGDADGMVSGASCTTANTIRPALQVLKTPNKTLVSSVFFMCMPDKVLVYGDCAVNVEPSAEELAQIAEVSANTAAAFGIEPRVAMLSYSTMGSSAGPQVDKVIKATRIVKEQRPDLKVEGPLQYDASVDPTIAAQKIKGSSEVAGKANICIFPDLNAGNNTYKAVQQSTGAIAIGPLMQGLSKPVNDLSRGCTVADVVNTAACTAVQAIGQKRKERGAAPA